MGMDEMRDRSLGSYARVRSSDASGLGRVLTENGAQVDMPEPETLHVRKMTTRRIGDIAFANGVRIYELEKHRPSLEQLFSELVEGRTGYRGVGPKPRPKRGNVRAMMYAICAECQKTWFPRSSRLCLPASAMHTLSGMAQVGSMEYIGAPAAFAVLISWGALASALAVWYFRHKDI